MPTYFEKYGHTLVILVAIVVAFIGLVTIVGNRFDAQDRFNNLLFERVNRRLNVQDQHFDAQDRLANQRVRAVNRPFEAVNQRLNAQNQYLGARVGLVNQRFEAVNQRLDRLTDEVSELRRLVVGIGERVSRNEGEIDVIREQLRIADTPSP